MGAFFNENAPIFVEVNVKVVEIGCGNIKEEENT